MFQPTDRISIGSIFDIVDQTKPNATRKRGPGAALPVASRVTGAGTPVTQNALALNREFSSQTLLFYGPVFRGSPPPLPLSVNSAVGPSSRWTWGRSLDFAQIHRPPLHCAFLRGPIKDRDSRQRPVRYRGAPLGGSLAGSEAEGVKSNNNNENHSEVPKENKRNRERLDQAQGWLPPGRTHLAAGRRGTKSGAGRPGIHSLPQARRHGRARPPDPPLPGRPRLRRRACGYAGQRRVGRPDVGRVPQAGTGRRSRSH